MKQYIEGVIVVEGAMDIAFLSNFIESEFVSVNGSAVDPKAIEYLKNLPQETPIYLLLDPDAPGEKIRHHLQQQLTHYTDVFIPQSFAKRKHKIGVAESNPTTVLEAFKQGLVKETTHVKSTISIHDLVSLGLVGSPVSKQKRERLESTFHLGHTNGKTFLTRLNRRGITFDQLKEVLDEKEF